MTLRLSKETLRTLNNEEADAVDGGASRYCDDDYTRHCGGGHQSRCCESRKCSYNCPSRYCDHHTCYCHDNSNCGACGGGGYTRHCW